MQRQRLSAAHRPKPSPPLPRSQPRYLKRPTQCNSQLILLSVLLVILTSLLLLGRTPSSFLYSADSSTPISLSILSRPDRYGIYEKAPSDAILSTPPLRLSYRNQNFTLDGKNIRLVSGSVHYFRMPPSRWRPVLEYATIMGLNAIETYVPWNLHEPSPGVFRWSGILDLRAFLEVAQEMGLLVLLRPGPYICSEWDMGGLPAWLLRDPDMKLRSTYPQFMRATARYFAEVAAQIRPYIGRPVVAVQVENEYGAYGWEKKYMQQVLNLWEGKRFMKRKVLYFTSDNGDTKTVLNGSQFGRGQVLKTVNLQYKVREKIKMLRYLQPKAPAMIAEFWVGWFDHWGETHHTRGGGEVMEKVEEVLFNLDANVNLYMFFGGTNFGFMAGANIDDDGTYLADVTSYDYDAMVAEWGEVRRDKFVPMHYMLRRFWAALGENVMLNRTSRVWPPAPVMSGYAGRIALNESIPLLDVLDVVADNAIISDDTISMEEVGGDYGFILYRHNLTESDSVGTGRLLRISGVRDFAYILFDGKIVKTIDRNRESESGGGLKTTLIPAGTTVLDIIVENRGRVNYGRHLHDRKGILGNVTIDSKPVRGFQCITMSFPQDHPLLRDPFGREVISIVKSRMKGRSNHPPMNDASSPPTFFKGVMSINPGSLKAFKGALPGTHCRVYGRGVLWVNGFNVGRFHTGVSGPQRALFVPGALLREGKNDFMVLHMNMHLAREPPIVQLFQDAQLGPTAQ